MAGGPRVPWEWRGVEEVAKMSEYPSQTPSLLQVHYIPVDMGVLKKMTLEWASVKGILLPTGQK